MYSGIFLGGNILISRSDRKLIPNNWKTLWKIFPRFEFWNRKSFFNSEITFENASEKFQELFEQWFILVLRFSEWFWKVFLKRVLKFSESFSKGRYFDCESIFRSGRKLIRTFWKLSWKILPSFELWSRKAVL